MKNLITDIEGILVGCAEDHRFSTGVTVLSGPSPFTAAVDVRGGGAGTRETEILKLESSIGRVDAIHIDENGKIFASADPRGDDYSIGE